MDAPRKRRIRPRLLILLWIWGLLMFLVVDLFRNVPEFDRVRPESALYEGMRKAAHEMVGERYVSPAGPTVLVAGAPDAQTRPTEASSGSRAPVPVPSRSVLHDLKSLGSARTTHGSYTRWNDPGPGPSSGEYVEGQRHGTWTWDWPDGTRREERQYRMGFLNGTVRAWYQDGALQIQERYQEGKEHGTWKWFYPDGTQAAQAEFANGKLDGALWKVHENGNRAFAGIYRSGRPEGPATRWHENGQKAEHGTFRLGRREGLWLFWDERGTEIRREVYIAGVIRD